MKMENFRDRFHNTPDHTPENTPENMPDHTPLISVIVPVYNGERYIGQCLDCLKSQTWTNLEILVVDDGSSDQTADIVRRYAAEDNRLTLISLPENRQLYQARIAGFSKAAGDFVITVDSDDRFSQDYLEMLVLAALDADAQLSICDHIHMFTENGKGDKTYMGLDPKRKYLTPYPNILKEFLAFQSQPESFDPWYTAIWNKMFCRKLLDRALPYLKEETEKILYYEDFIFSLVLFYFSEKTVFTKSGTYYYRRSAQSAMGKTFHLTREKNLADRMKMLSFMNRFFEKIELDQEHKKQFEEWMQKLSRALQFPQISTAGLKVLGQGKSGSVYELGHGTVVKIYRNSFGEKEVVKEFAFSSLLNEAQIPSAKAIKIVRCGESYGIIYEQLNGISLKEYLYREPENISLYAFLYARAVKSIHSKIPANDPDLSVRPIFDHWVSEISVFTVAERNMVKMVLDSIPRRKNLLHMDPMPENLLFLKDGSMAWIDFEGCGVGHPVFSLQNIYFPDFIGMMPGISQRDASLLPALWKSFRDAYFEGVPKNRMPAIERSIHFLTYLRFLHQVQSLAGTAPLLTQAANMLKPRMWEDLAMGLDYQWE